MRRRAHTAPRAHASRHRARVGIVPRRESRHRRRHHPRRRDARNRPQPARRIRPRRRRARGLVLAHAELDALAKLRWGSPSDGLELWTTLQPCLQCLGAVRLSPVRKVHAPRAGSTVPGRRRSASPQRVHRPAMAGDHRAAASTSGPRCRSSSRPTSRPSGRSASTGGTRRCPRSPSWPPRSSLQANCSSSQPPRPRWIASPKRCGHVCATACPTSPP